MDARRPILLPTWQTELPRNIQSPIRDLDETPAPTPVTGFLFAAENDPAARAMAAGGIGAALGFVLVVLLAVVWRQWIIGRKRHVRETPEAGRSSDSLSAVAAVADDVKREGDSGVMVAAEAAGQGSGRR
jgi:hypothetical protein